MKKLIFFLFAIPFFISSCEYKVDNSNLWKVGEAINHGLVKKDTVLTNKLFQEALLSQNEVRIGRIKSVKEFFNKYPDLEIIKQDTSTFDYLDTRYIDIFYKKDSDIYKLQAICKNDSIGNIQIRDIYFINLNEECENYNNSPYNPSSDIEVKTLSWRTDYYTSTFKSGNIELQNHTDLDINYLRFRLILRKNTKNFSDEIFFNQTIESYKPIYKGDIVMVNIPGMENFYGGFPINRNTLNFSVELMEVRPKPESYLCTELSKIKDEIIKKV